MLRQTLIAFLLGTTIVSGQPVLAEAIPGAAAVTRVHHVVIVWLNDAGSPAAREQYIAHSRQLAKLPMVIDYHVGTALPGRREIVDSSYDVAVVSTFANQQAVTEYSEHPEHKRIVEQALKPLVAKAVVYDFAEAP